MDPRSWHAEQLARYVGRRIVQIRPLTDIELASEGWQDCDPGQSVAVIFDDNSGLIVQGDPEGSGPGYLRGATVIA